MGRKAQLSRRDFMRNSLLVGAGLATPALLDALGTRRTRAQNAPLRAAMSNDGLAASWCAQGKAAAEQWGRWLGVEITWFDGQLDGDIQRGAVEAMAAESWDFVAIQAHEINILQEPVQTMINNGIPVIAMDTLIAPIERQRQMGILSLIAPDNVFMSESVVRALIEKMGGEGKIAMTGGSQGHTGAQGRAQGFSNVVSQFPNIEVVDVQWTDWNTNRAVEIWLDLISQHPDIRAGFLHSDDLALAAREVAEDLGLEDQILFASVDAMVPAIQAVLDGRLVATVRNPSPRIHGSAVLMGTVAATLGMEQARTVIPDFIPADGPVITNDVDVNPTFVETPWRLRSYGQSTAAGALWLQEQLIF
jgi:ribose transport system substrate-binding protein